MLTSSRRSRSSRSARYVEPVQSWWQDPDPGAAKPQVIPPSLVHKLDPAQQLVHTAQREGENSAWRMTVTCPRDFSATSPVTAGLWGLVGLEVMRQVGTALAHLEGGVPTGWAFLLDELAFTAFEAGSLPLDTPAGSPLYVVTRASDVVRRKGVVAGLVAHGDLWAQGQWVARGVGTFRCVDPRTYRAVRRHAPDPASIPPRHDGALLLDVDPGPGRLRARLGWDSDDALFFDHPLDHVPGMLFAAASLQAHARLTATQARAIDLRFHRYGELVGPISMSSSSDHGASTTTFEQDGAVVAQSRCES